MTDLIILAIIAAFSLACWGIVRLCQRLMKPE
jgi:hypothetical protein